MFLLRCIKIIWFIVCLSGNLYQVGEISSDFFQYDIVTTINVAYPEDFFVPAMSVCLWESQTVNLDKLTELKPSWKEELNVTTMSHEELHHFLMHQDMAGKRKSIGMMFGNLTARERAYVSYSFNELFGWCLLVQPDGSSQTIGNCTNMYDIVSYRFAYYTCWSFNFKSDDYLLNFLDSNRADTVAGMLYMMTFTPLALGKLAEAVFSYNTNRETDRMGYYRFLFLSELHHLISLSYDEYSSYLLPEPYVTKCRVYADGDSESIIDRGSCFESCLKNRSAEYLGPNLLLPSIYIFDNALDKHDLKYSSLTDHELLLNKSLVKMKYNWSKECDKVCYQSACNETFDVPSFRSSIEYSMSAFITYVMQSPKIETICNPKLSFVVFITNIFSTFGFWIGLSLFNFVEIIFDFIERQITKSRTRGIEPIPNTWKDFVKQQIIKSQQKPNTKIRNYCDCDFKRRSHSKKQLIEEQEVNYAKYKFFSSLYDNQLLLKYPPAPI